MTENENGNTVLFDLSGDDTRQRAQEMGWPKALIVLAWVFVASMALIVASLGFHSWVLATLWSWFLAPAGLPALAWTNAVGFILIASLVLAPVYNETEMRPFLRVVVFGFLAPMITLVLGWMMQAIFM